MPSFSFLQFIIFYTLINTLQFKNIIIYYKYNGIGREMEET